MVILFVSFFILYPSSFADVTSEDIENALLKKLEHPYLYFTEQEKSTILERINNDPESHNIMAKLLAEANRWMNTPVEKQFPPQCRDNRFYNDGKYDALFYSYIEAMYTLAFVYQMTGNEKYAHKSFEFAYVICDLPTWVDRALQFPKAYMRVSPWNVTDDKVVFHYGIWSAWVSFHMSPVYDWLYPVLTKRQRDRIRGALLEKVITRVRGNWEYHWWATAYRCNWCTSSCAGLGLAALALLTEDPHLTDVIAESYNRICRTFDEIGIDGGWQEGVGYSHANHNVAVIFGDPIKRLTGGKYNLMKHPKMQEHAVSFYVNTLLPPDNVVNFGDSGNRTDRRSTYAFNKLADETGSGEVAWYREMLGEGTGINDLIWPRSAVKPVPPESKSSHFRTIDWIVMRSDYTDTEKVVIACKSGKNDDPHHGHLDIGSFILQWRGQAFIKDIGSGPYDEPYFDEVRWNYPEASSAGHNVVFVNGELQIPGKRFRKAPDESIGGKILEFRPGKDRDYILMDSTDAYPKKELKGWRRHITLEKPTVTVILDEVRSKIGAEIEARFFSECVQKLNDDYILLEGERGHMALIPVVDGDFTLRPGKLMDLPVKKDARLEEIPYTGTVVKARNTMTDIFSIILPVRDDSEARRILNTVRRTIDSAGNLSVSFAYDGKTYTYNYVNSEDGLILKQER